MSGDANENRTKGRAIDPVTANVIQGALENIAVEMGYKLMRMSYSSIIRESEDFGAAIIDLLFDLRDRHGATLILVTHAPELASRCDRVISLRDGRIA